VSKKREKSIGGSLKAAMQKAWDAFESTENQDRMAKLETEASRRDEMIIMAERAKKLRRWGVPKIAAELVAKDAEDSTAAVLAVREHEGALLLVLAGNPGCGKTVAACTRIEDRETGCFVRAAELVELGNHYSDRDRLARYRRCGVLVVDDLGVEYRSEQMICRLDELVDSRAASNLPTIITTNLTASEFQARYESRLWSRIHQFGDYIELDDPDLRVTPIGSGRRS
jgi:DNA replication protein DnaC